ncbi:phage tail sheath protein [Gluconobacter japonicus]|nr:phage tail sheath protein [Gluconobacter japonicus]
MKDIIVTSADTSLFHVAAKELGDACQWWRIADFNGLNDPDLGWVETVLTLKIPGTVSESSSGLPDDVGQ